MDAKETQGKKESHNHHFKEKSLSHLLVKRKKNEFTTIRKHATLNSCLCPCDPFKSPAR